jgi:hypothetical protein
VSTLTHPVDLIGKPLQTITMKPAIGGPAMERVASDVVSLAAQITAEQTARESAAWREYRAIIKTAAEGGDAPDLAALRAIMELLKLAPEHIDQDIACLKNESSLMAAKDTASAKAAELLPRTTEANQRVADLESELRAAQDEARQVGALHWSASATAGERADDLKRLRKANPRIYAALK